MTYAVTFDTHKAIKSLIGQGVPPAQAEVFVDVIRDSRETETHALVTKCDLSAALAELEVRLMNARREDMRWIMGLLLAIMGVLVTIIFKLH